MRDGGRVTHESTLRSRSLQTTVKLVGQLERALKHDSDEHHLYPDEDDASTVLNSIEIGHHINGPHAKKIVFPIYV